MMTKDKQIGFANLAWTFALTRSIGSVPAGPERDALAAARDTPNLATIRSLLAIGQHRPWLELIEAVLIGIGLAAIDDILEGHQS